MCQSSRCSPKRGRHEVVLVRMLGPKGRVDLGAVPHQLEEGKSVSRMLGPEGRWIVMSHIG